jgi:hypothetical protein
MAPEIKYWLLRSDNVRLAVLGREFNTRTVREDELEKTMVSMGIPPIVEINKRTAYQKDGISTNINPWDDNVIAFLPRTSDGKLGEIQPANEDSVYIQDPGVNYTDAGNGIRIAKWSMGESSGQQAAEFTQGSWRAIPILTSAKAIVNFKVRDIATPYPTGETLPMG